MLRIYCPSPSSAAPLHFLFYFRFEPGKKVGGLFKDSLPENFFENPNEVEYVPEAGSADFMLLPNNFTSLNQEASEYISHYADVAQENNIPVYIFSCGDHTDRLRFDPRVEVFRYSLYRSNMQRKDISTPTLTEDLGKEGVKLRVKQDMPVISFCGKAEFGSMREFAASWARLAVAEAKGLVRAPEHARIRGVFWRRWAIQACRRSALISTLFVIRKSFSGARKTIELDPLRARKEFIESIRDSDFVLAPKGDGNYSNRFLEALSMGRVPVLIDTDVVLPFENTIDYSKIVVRVPMNKVKDIPTYVRNYYDRLSPEEWQMRQRLAREAFEEYLRQDVFFQKIF